MNDLICPNAKTEIGLAMRLSSQNFANSEKCINFAQRTTEKKHTQVTMSLPLDEEKLIEQLRDNKTRNATFSAVVKAYSEMLYWHIRRMVISHDDANDILQNTFTKAWMGIDGFLGNAKLLTWLYRIATNETLTFINKNSNTEFEDIDTVAAAIEADEWFDGDDLQARLQAAIQTLPPKQRIVFNMKYYDEMKYEEMSTILGTSTGALKASYHIAVKKICEYFDNEN